MKQNLKIRLIGFTAIMLIVAVLSFTSLLLFDTLCLIRGFTGLPCPGCGMTRAYINLFFKFNFLDAFYYHPLFLTIPFIFAVAILAVVKPHIAKTKWFNIVMYIGFASFLICYVTRMIIYFPDTLPLSYNFKSLIGRIIKLLSK